MILIRQYLQLFIKFRVNKTLFCYLFPVVCIYRLCDIFPITVFIDYYYSMSQMCYVHVIFVIMIQIRQYLQLFIKLRVNMTRFLLFISSRLYLPLVWHLPDHCAYWLLVQYVPDVLCPCNLKLELSLILLTSLIVTVHLHMSCVCIHV